MNDYLVITCEHGGNRIPARYCDLFRGYAALLTTHRGYDAGALTMARELAREFAAPLVAATVSRLLIDLNRSIGHRHLYSGATRNLAKKVRAEIVRDHYRPYRNEVEGLVQRAVCGGKNVIHVSSHSFTPELDGEVRDADIGLLFDPKRAGEALLAGRWQAALKAAAPKLKVRRNYPYAGKADGLTCTFRRSFSPAKYVGIELEINQKHAKAGARWRQLRRIVAATLRAALSE
ncbi:MAG: N-formylglutamate amidohydrolase [Burkholderiales bacterium]|nr:N-formylglutamate amidohydrolase [Pseudomonadota bacterium]